MDNSHSKQSLLMQVLSKTTSRKPGSRFFPLNFPLCSTSVVILGHDYLWRVFE